MILGAKVLEMLLNLPGIMKQSMKDQTCRNGKAYKVQQPQLHRPALTFKVTKSYF